jgi:hypothetical protein
MDSGRALASDGSLLQVGKCRPSRFSCTEFLDIHKVDGRDEALGLPRLRYFGVELVHLFERKTLGFIDAEVDKDNTDDAESTPDEEHLRSEIADQLLAGLDSNT